MAHSIRLLWTVSAEELWSAVLRSLNKWMVMGRRGRGVLVWECLIPLTTTTYWSKVSVVGWLYIANLNAVETEGTQVEFNGGVLDGAGEMSAKVAKGEQVQNCLPDRCVW